MNDEFLRDYVFKVIKKSSEISKTILKEHNESESPVIPKMNHKVSNRPL